MIKYFNKKIETLSRDQLENLQLKRLKETIEGSLKIDFYKKRLNEIGIKSSKDIKNFADLKKIPFTSKNDLRSSYPKGFLAVNRDKIIRIHTSSGTT
jgi:phenylacetate-CoA ligase